MSWLRKVLGNSSGAPTAQPRETRKSSQQTDSKPLPFIDDESLQALAEETNDLYSVPVHEAADEDIAYTAWDAEFGNRLNEVEKLRRKHPVASEQDDVAELIRSLSDGPDAVIRQLPAAARDTLMLLDDPNVSRAKLAETLGSDPALMQSLLRTANSAIFSAGRGQVLTIGQSLDRIGMDGARSVVLASSVQGLLSQPGGEFTAMATKVWDHMVRMAPLARALAPAFNADREETFAVAVLHDVGKLIVFDRISHLRTQRRRSLVIDVSFASVMLQHVHESLGALAAARWGIGERGAQAIGTHHRLGSARTSANPIAEAVYLAERADHAEQRGEALDLEVVWRQGWLSGTPAAAAAILDEMRAVAV